LFCWTSTCNINRQSGYPFKEPELIYPAKIDFLKNAIKSKDSKAPKLTDQEIKGKKLFQVNCASCHNRNMVDDLTGPALRDVTERWSGRETLLYDWIRNSQKVISTGDPYAVELYKKWNKNPMNAFPNLTDENIADLLSYIERE